MHTPFMDEVESMNKFRYSLIHKRNSFWNEEAGKYEYDTLKEDEQKIDELAIEIERYIKLYFDQLPVAAVETIQDSDLFGDVHRHRIARRERRRERDPIVVIVSGVRR